MHKSFGNVALIVLNKVLFNFSKGVGSKEIIAVNANSVTYRQSAIFFAKSLCWHEHKFENSRFHKT